jgi:hypothetical protein
MTTSRELTTRKSLRGKTMILDFKNTLDENLNWPRRIPEYLEIPPHLKDAMTKHIERLRVKKEEAITRWNKKHDEAN